MEKLDKHTSTTSWCYVGKYAVRKEASPWYVTSHAMGVGNSGYPTIVRVYETGALIGRARVVFGVSVQGRG